MKLAPIVSPTLEGALVQNPYLMVKNHLSLLLAAPLAFILAPLILFLWSLVKLTSRGPGFYSQVRLGRRGRPFTIYKLRTMVVDAEAASGPVWASRNDPRVTRVGVFLRKYHLDELPQVFNVLAGDMCFVGPRPERPEIAEQLAESIPDYYDRLVVKPGVTGMAQLHLPPDTDLKSVCEKLGYDLTYIQRASLALDSRVFLATLFKAIPGVDGLAARLSYRERFVDQAKTMCDRFWLSAPRRQRRARRRQWAEQTPSKVNSFA